MPQKVVNFESTANLYIHIYCAWAYSGGKGGSVPPPPKNSKMEGEMGKMVKKC